MQIIRLEAADIGMDILEHFRHCQSIGEIWVCEENSWRIAGTNETRSWSSDKRQWIAGYMCEQIARGGCTLTAYEDHVLTGFCCVDGVLLGESARYANLTMLFVDDKWQRRGIGRALFEEACRFAFGMGANKLFISAIASVETVAFYAAMGCTDAQEIVEAFVDTERDRCLERVLSI